MSYSSSQVLLAARPSGFPEDETWEITKTDIPEPSSGQFVVKTDYISLDPAMRGWLNETRSYVPPVGIGEVMRASATGVVVASAHPDFQVGQPVVGLFGVTEYALSDGSGVRAIDLDRAAAPTWLGALGMPGFTAYFGLTEIGKISAGDTVVISAAAGAVGSVAGQIAKAMGCTVIGIAGGSQKVAWLREIGFDEAIDYKNEKVIARLRELAPDGIDIYFDNVGGEVLDAALANLRHGARVVLCGAISGYNEATLPPGPQRYMSLLVFRASMTGFLVFDYQDRYDEAIEAIGSMMADGRLVARETIVDGGVQQFGEALLGLYRGINTGKLVLEV